MSQASATRNVIISGLTAAGKTTHSHLLAGQFGMQYVSSSQVLLALLGKFPVQPRDFWLTDEAQALWEREESHRVDGELVRLEEGLDEVVFDAVSLPWLHTRRAFVVWLESTLSSRVAKAIVSHRGRGRFSELELESRIIRKDDLIREQLRKGFGFNLFSDRAPFDLVIDISRCLSEPTLESSLKSVDIAHEVIRPAVGWYLTNASSFRAQFRTACRKHTSVTVLRGPAGLGHDGDS